MILQKHYLVEFVLITIPKAISKILYIQPNVFTPGRGFVNAFSYGDMRTTPIHRLLIPGPNRKKNVRFLSVILHKESLCQK